MKVLVGLGNPGTKYLKNRHNAGHMLVDFLKQKEFGQVKLTKTDCYMNQSGQFVKRLLSENQQLTLDDLYIAHDDLDIPLGKYKIQKGNGPKIHNGLNSIRDTLGTHEFWYVRIGIDNRDPQNRVDGESYVLSDFTSEEKVILNQIFEEITLSL